MEKSTQSIKSYPHQKKADELVFAPGAGATNIPLELQHPGMKCKKAIVATVVVRYAASDTVPRILPFCSN